MNNVLETDRLIFRTWEPKDAIPFYNINRDSKVTEYLLGPLSHKDVDNWIIKFNKQQDERGHSLWAAELKQTNELIGFVGLNYTAFEAEFTPAVEVGWRLGSQFWGNGYATEGGRAAVKFGFEQIGLSQIVSFTVPKNVRSTNVMQKLGLERDMNGDFEHPIISRDHRLSKHVLYRITKEQYLAIKP